MFCKNNLITSHEVIQKINIVYYNNVIKSKFFREEPLKTLINIFENKGTKDLHKL